MKILGVDPGLKGSCSVFDGDKLIAFHNFSTENDTAQFIAEQNVEFAFLEEVHSRPGNAAQSMFVFGTNYGFYRGVLFALGIPFMTVTPQKWQKEMRCLTRGDKNVSKQKAQELFPKIKITHANADGILIGAYGAGVKKGSTARPPSFRGTSYFEDFLT